MLSISCHSIVLFVFLVASSMITVHGQQQQPAISPQQPSLTNQQPSLTNQQPSLTNQQPSLTNPQPSLTNQQPSLTNQQPSLTNQQPSLTNQQPSLTNKQPSLTNQQPSLTNQQPSLTNLTPLQSKLLEFESEWRQENEQIFGKIICSPNTINSKILNDLSLCVKNLNSPKQQTNNLQVIEAKRKQIENECSKGLDSQLSAYKHVNLTDDESRFNLLSYCVWPTFQDCADEKMKAYFDANKQLKMELDREQAEGKHGIVPNWQYVHDCKRYVLGANQLTAKQDQIIVKKQDLHKSYVSQIICSPDKVNTSIIQALRQCRPETVEKPKSPNIKIVMDKINQFKANCSIGYDNELGPFSGRVDLNDLGVKTHLLTYCMPTFAKCMKQYESFIHSDKQLAINLYNDYKQGLLQTTTWYNAMDCEGRLLGIQTTL
ncbi:uncharacterized protein LOC128953180 [Oppia nitens]|uniref:uncharacterized protein LOC128953180 n=1 Tax=Oppia nitens TaxID=1686743 RepID=UPI0023D979A0|nr:uncharacterized protein LOC128953180 [Oppia nitens]